MRSLSQIYRDEFGDEEEEGINWLDSWEWFNWDAPVTIDSDMASRKSEPDLTKQECENIWQMI